MSLAAGRFFLESLKAVTPIKNRTLFVALSFALVAAACGGDNSAPSSDAPASNPATSVDSVDPALQELAADVCRAAVWTGLERGMSFQGELDTTPIPGVTETELAYEVRSQCPDAFYDPLNSAELDWCGSGELLSRNFLRVVETGVELKLASFSVVDLPLLRKANRIGADLSDYEVELFTVEIVSMAATSGFSRDWAAACRATL